MLYSPYTNIHKHTRLPKEEEKRMKEFDSDKQSLRTLPSFCIHVSGYRRLAPGGGGLHKRVGSHEARSEDVFVRGGQRRLVHEGSSSALERGRVVGAGERGGKGQT